MRLFIIGWVCLSLLGGAPSGTGQIVVEGVQDLVAPPAPASFRVVTEPGYAYHAWLNGLETPVAVWVVVDQPGYYELRVTRQDSNGGAAIERSLRFVVMDPERGDAEWGLFPWTPRPLVDSSRAELASAHLELIAPQQYPAGMAIPLITLTEDAPGQAIRLNGMARLEGFPNASFPVKRGVGFGFITPSASSGAVNLRATLGILQTARELRLTSTPSWTEIAGDITNHAVWPSNSYVHVTSAFAIGEGATLTVEAGSVVMLAPGVSIDVAGKLEVQGSRAAPVVFAPADRTRPWGGFVCWKAPAELAITGAIFTASGADSHWFDTHAGGGSHRREEALFYLGPGVKASFSDTYLIDHRGQAFHGEDASLTMDRCLIQQCQTAGQFNGGSVIISRSALLDFPTNDLTYVDGDNDALYLTRGHHEFTQDLIGWTKDDGIDAGADAAGEVTVENCWFEACFHEGMALSGTDKIVRAHDSVFLNCGQGVEAGYLSPRVYVDHCLLGANEIGARFGDNYEIPHSGWLQVTNSLCLDNHRGVWGMDRVYWAEDFSLMDVRGNWLSAPNAHFPENQVFQPDTDAERLASFLPTGSASVGVGFLSPTSSGSAAHPEISVGLSAFSTQAVSVDYAVTGGTAVPGWDYAPAAGTLRFAPGDMFQSIPLRILGALDGASRSIEITLSNPRHAEVSARQSAHSFVMLGADTDHDGLPDAWEQRIIDADPLDSLVSVQDVSPADDFDRDGMSNGQEYRAGTDPADPESYLRLDLTYHDGTTITLGLRTEAGRAYTVEYRDDLSGRSAWSHLTDISAQPQAATRVVVDHPPDLTRSRFYRVSVPLAPETVNP